MIIYDWKNKTACFTGHRNVNKNEIKNLRGVIENLINLGINNFLSGGAIGFDQIAATEVINLKDKYSHIKLILILPCSNEEQTRNWIIKDRKNFIL